MRFKILTSHRFDGELKRLAKKFPSLKLEYGDLIETLEENPALGTAIKFNCYKIRLSIASKGKGKSGGARVVTFVHVRAEIVYLLTIYDKSEIANISDKELEKLLVELRD